MLKKGLNRRATWYILITLLLVLLSSTVAIAESGKVPVLIGFADQSEPGLVESQGGEIKYVYKHINAIAARLPEAAIENLKKNKKIKYIEPDMQAKALGETFPWGIDRIDAELVYPITKGAGVKVAVLDTGIDYTHPDLAVAGGATFVAGTIDYRDDNGHGTHVAGTIAAVDNDYGVIGAAPEAQLFAVKVLDSAGSGYYSDIAKGIDWAIGNGIKVINMSLGGTYDSITLRDACDRAYAAGVLLVAASGNESSGVSFPAKYSSVMAISAIDSGNNLAGFSNTGAEVELAAPGVSILSTYPGGYAYGDGTSMASPHVAGAAVLVMAANPVLTNAEVRQRLQQNAVDLGTSGFDYQYGYGLLNAYAAATFSPQPQPEPLKNLAVTVTTNLASVKVGNTVYITTTVKDELGNAVPAASVHVEIITPKGVTYYRDGLTAVNGTFLTSFKTDRYTAVGEYKVKSTASLRGYNSGVGITTFKATKK